MSGKLHLGVVDHAMLDDQASSSPVYRVRDLIGFIRKSVFIPKSLLSLTMEKS